MDAFASRGIEVTAHASLGRDDGYATFSRRNNRQLDTALNHATSRLLELADNSTAQPRSSHERHAGAVFCEPSPYWPEGSWEAITERLRRFGYQPTTATRLDQPPPTIP